MITCLNRISDPHKTKFKILTFPTHEGYQTTLSKTGQEFYMMMGPNIKQWDFHTRPLPPNHYIYNQDIDHNHWIEDFDLILCQNRQQQFNICQSIGNRLQIPIIVLDHTEPPPNALKMFMKQLREMRGDKHVYITEHNKNTWDDPDGIVINHGIDTDIFTGWNGLKNCGISVVNLFPERDVFCGWNIWQEISQSINIDLFGFNPSLKTKSINDISELVSELSQHRYYLNTSQHSPVPLSMLEAMAVGCPIVTTDKQEISKIIEHGVNGFKSNNTNELIDYCKQLENDYELAKSLGQAARQTILDKFNINRFCVEWNKVFMDTYYGS